MLLARAAAARARPACEPQPPPRNVGDDRAGRNAGLEGEHQRLVLAKPELIARAFVTQMLTYATGAEPSYADRREIERILAETKTGKFGVRSLIHAMAESRLFQNK